nr:SOS response-associated peptidase family protein [Aureimonas sp. AU12]
MCDLYAIMKDQPAIRGLTRATKDRAGPLSPLPVVFPDDEAPVVRSVDGVRELTRMRWGLPSPAFATKGRPNDPGVAIIRSLKSPHWRPWLSPEHRCLVPFTSLAQYETTPERRKLPVWYAVDESRPLMVFAGVWCRWTGVRKVEEGEVSVDVFGLLTVDATKTVGAMNPKAFPLILTEADEMDVWLRAPWSEASKLLRPLPAPGLSVVARGRRKDG